MKTELIEIATIFEHAKYNTSMTIPQKITEKDIERLINILKAYKQLFDEYEGEKELNDV